MSNAPSKAEIEALVKRHGATSYRNRADTQHPAYGFTEDGLNDLIDEVLAKWGTPPAEQAAPKAAPGEQSQPRYSHLHDADAVHGKRLSVYSKPPAEQQAQSAGPCVICGSDAPFTGTCGSGDPRALCKQAAPKAAPGEQNAVSAEWLEQAYREGWAACRDAETIGEEAEDWAFGNSTANSRMIDAQQAAPQQEPVAYVHVPHYTVEGKVRPVVSFDKYQQDYADGIYSTRIPLYTAPQPAPAPLSEMPYEKRKAIQEGEQIGASDAWFKARHEMLDTLDRRNVFRAGFDRGWNAALAAQGGKA